MENDKMTSILQFNYSWEWKVNNFYVIWGTNLLVILIYSEEN